MTVEAALPIITSVDSATVAPSRGSRSLARQAVVDTLSRSGARFGLIWIALLVLASVFSPLIASSYPLLARESGHLTSPALNQFTPADICWLVAFVAAIALAIFRRATFSASVGTVVWVIGFTLPFTLWPTTIDAYRFGGLEPLTWVVIGVVAMGDCAIVVLGAISPRVSARYKLIVALCVAPVAVTLVVHPVRPPQANVYEVYRVAGEKGSAFVILPAPIPYSPNDFQRDVPDARLQPPSFKHWMGTEQSGADVFSRMLHASRIALSVGFIATGIAMLIGVLIGGLMGYFVGMVDMLGMRVIEIFEALPRLILLLTVCAFFGRNLYLMMALIGLLSWTGDARFVRAEFLTLRNQDFVHAAIASGLPLRSVMFRHMLPNGLTPVLVNASFGVASAILTESVLSFLGLGLVDEPSWGQLLNQARAGGTGFQWWIATFPGLAIFLTVFAYNLIGEAVRDAIDPRLRKRD